MEILAAVIFLVVIGIVSQTAAAATVAAFLLFGTMGFWALLAISSILILTCIENDREFAAFLSVIGTAVAVQLFSGVSLLHILIYNPAAIFWGALLYLAIGTAWSFFKWFLHVKDERKEYDKKLVKYEEKLARTKKMTPADRHWNKPPKPDAEIPQAMEYKSRIVGWMTFWPWSALWFVINDPVRRAFNAIYEKLQGTYQSIANSAFAGVEIEDDA